MPALRLRIPGAGVCHRRHVAPAGLGCFRGQPPQTAPEDPFVEPQPQAAPVPGLQFQEPVRTVGSGDQMITLRRLTPEERAVRRARRNMIMMLTGVSILMAIVLVFGTKRSKRRE